LETLKERGVGKNEALRKKPKDSLILHDEQYEEPAIVGQSMKNETDVCWMTAMKDMAAVRT